MLPLYQLGEVDWITTQTLYHGLAKLNQEGIVLCWPRTPYVSLGCHQDWEDYDESSGVPVVRRKVGGSLVYLDRHQVFFQVIVDPRRIPENRTPESWYRYALDPVVGYLRQIGLSAEMRLPADILVGGRKLSGNAGGQIEERVVVVGNLLLDFSVEAMAGVRTAPHTVWRQAFADSMRRHLTTLKEWIPYKDWSAVEVMEDLAKGFAEHLGAVPTPFPWEQWGLLLDEVGRELIHRKWLIGSQRKKRDPYHSVKVREGVYLRASRDPRYPHIVAEVDKDRRRILRVWGMPENPAVLTTMEGTREAIEAAPLEPGLTEVLLDFLG